MAPFAQVAGVGYTIAEAEPPAMLSRLRDRLFRQDDRRSRFDRAVLPHLDAAYDLARWLTRNDQDAEDVLQTACLRALQFFDGFHGVNARAWLLTIVRNSFYTWLEQRNRGHESADPFDEEIHSAASRRRRSRDRAAAPGGQPAAARRVSSRCRSPSAR